jgi:uncharacterized protein DUF3520/protein with von Willebrand factor-like domain
MSKWNERVVARRLAARDDVEPPPGLLERIQAEIPAELPVAKKIPAAPRQEAADGGRGRWLIAASLVAMLGAGVIALRVMVRVPPVGEPANVSAVPDRSAEAAKPVPPAAPPRIPPPAAAPRPAAPEELQQRAAAPPAGEAQAKEQVARELAESVPESRDRLAPPAAPPPPPAAAAPAPMVDEAPLRSGAPAAPKTRALRREQERKSAAPQPLAVPGGVEGGVPGGVARGVMGGVAGGVPGATADRAEPQGQPSGRAFVRPAGSFVDTGAERLSTFGLDVDGSSYVEMRRDLAAGRLPPPERVRVEEFLNFFRYGDPAPVGQDFAIRAEGAPSPDAPGGRYRLLRFNLRAREAAGTPRPVAENARVQVEFNPGAVVRYRLLGYESRDAAGRRSEDVTVQAAKIDAGHSVTALYEIELQPAAPAGQPLATLRLRYRSTTTGGGAEAVREVRAADFAPTWEAAPPALRLATVVAEFAEVLRGSDRAKGVDLHELRARAERVSADFPGNADVAELARLVGEAMRLKEQAR